MSHYKNVYREVTLRHKERSFKLHVTHVTLQEGIRRGYIVHNMEGYSEGNYDTFGNKVDLGKIMLHPVSLGGIHV